MATHEYVNNTDTAAVPQAIRAWPPPKLPISDNDPTRDVSRRRGAQRMLLAALCAVALATLLVATVMVLIQRG